MWGVGSINGSSTINASRCAKHSVCFRSHILGRTKGWAGHVASLHSRSNTRTDRREFVCNASNSGFRRFTRPGISHREDDHNSSFDALRKRFPILKYWPLLRKVLVTLTMLILVRSLYFIPIKGISIQDVPPAMQLSSPEQAVLSEMFLAGNSIPLNLASLGLTPIVFGSLIVSSFLSVEGCQYFPLLGKIAANLRTKRKTGTLTPEDVDRCVIGFAIAIGTYMAISRSLVLQKYAFAQNFVRNTVVDLLASLSITRYACSIIQDSGLGEGTGFIILGLTLSGFAERLYGVCMAIWFGQVAIWKGVTVALLYLTIVAASVWINKAEMRLPMTDYSMKRAKATLLNNQSRLVDVSSAKSSARSPYLPLPIAQGGVTAIFFCSALFGIFDSWVLSLPNWAAIFKSWVFRFGTFGVGVFLVALLPVGTSSPEMISEFLTKVESGVRGVIPGDPTVRHLKGKLFQAKMVGGAALGIISTASLWLDMQSRVWFGTPIGTLNLILLVAVISSTERQIQSLLEGPKLQRIMDKEKAVVEMLRADSK